MAIKTENAGPVKKKFAAQRFALVISRDSDTKRYYFKVYDEARNLVFAPSDTEWENVFRKFTAAGYYLLLSEVVGKSGGITLWEIDADDPPAKPQKKKGWPIFRTAAARFSLVIDREDAPKRYYFKIYDEHGAPICVTTAETFAEARQKLKDAGYHLLLDEVSNTSETRVYWKVAR